MPRPPFAVIEPYRTTPSRRRRGHTALAVVVSLLCATGALLAFVAAAFGPDVEDLAVPGHESLRLAAEDVVALALVELWGPLERNGGPGGASLADARARLEALGVGAGGERVDLLSRVHLPKDGAEGAMGARLGEVRVDALWCSRADRDRRTLVSFVAHVRPRILGAGPEAVASAASAPVQRIERVVEIDDAPWNSNGFALVADRIDAPTSPIAVDSAARVFNRDAQRAGSFEAVRAAITGDLRASGGRLAVAGSLFVGGELVDGAGRSITDPARAAVAAWRVGPDGRIDERADLRAADGAFAAVERVVVPAFDSSYGGNEALYLEQAGSPGWPRTFPEPEPDPVVGGTLRSVAARLVVVPLGAACETDVLADHVPGQKELADVVAGHLLAVGTDSAPLELDGELVVEGDLVLSGVVRGNGRLVVRGTVWLPSDVIWDDGHDAESAGARTLGLRADGGTNGLWIAANGDVVVGNPFDSDGELRDSFVAAASANGGKRFVPSPSAGWATRRQLAAMFERLLAERARWRALEIDAGLYAQGTIGVCAADDAVGTSGRASVVGCVLAPRLVVDAPAGLRILFDPRAPQGLDVRDGSRARLRRLGAPAPATP